MKLPSISYCLHAGCFLQMARMAGLEPATSALTVRRTTIVLHPNFTI